MENDPYYQVRPLMDLIGAKEARGDYNLAYGNKKDKFTDMSLNELLDWQKEYVKSGSPSSAVGKYQIIRPTLKGLMRNMKLTGDEKFTPEMQDAMIVELMKGRNYDDWMEGKISDEEFANNLAQEWASFPVVTDMEVTDKKTGKKRKLARGESYYEGVGTNKALITPEEVLESLRMNKPQYMTMDELLGDYDYFGTKI
jgi:muramidase (phage lysozyme)